MYLAVAGGTCPLLATSTFSFPINSFEFSTKQKSTSYFLTLAVQDIYLIFWFSV